MSTIQYLIDNFEHAFAYMGMASVVTPLKPTFGSLTNFASNIKQV